MDEHENVNWRPLPALARPPDRTFWIVTLLASGATAVLSIAGDAADLISVMLMALLWLLLAATWAGRLLL